jgi:excisionase family DNA binding protein
MSSSVAEPINATFGNKRSIVASVNEAMIALKIGRAKIYQLLNSGELESYREGGSRKILWRSIESYVERRLAEEVKRRTGAA